MKAVHSPFGIGPSVSLFTLGTMRAVRSPEQMYEVVKAAYLAGINHIETAPAYGSAENFLGEALKQLDSQRITPDGGWVITSKLLPGISLSKGKKQLKEILSKLGLKKINNLAVHGLNLQEHLNWALNEEGAELLQWAEENNLIEQVGFSSHGKFSLIQKAIESNRFQFCSLHLHLLDQARLPLAKQALNAGMGVMAISPADKGGQLQNPSQTLIEDCFPIAPLELAYRFLLSQGISTLTVGASKAKDLEIAKKLANANSLLNELEISSLNKMQRESSRRLGLYKCGQCSQCIPCPKKVPIPEILRLRNLLIGSQLEVFTKERYRLIGKAGHWWETVDASACENCGDCLPRCPNKLEIPALLKETHQKLSGESKRRLWG